MIKKSQIILSLSLFVGTAACSPMNTDIVPNSAHLMGNQDRISDNTFKVKGLGYLPSDEDLTDSTITEFLVNTITTAAQAQPVVSMDKSGGNFVVAWATNHEVDARYNIYGRRFQVDPSDETINDGVDSAEFKINNDAGARNYTNPTIAMNPNGNHFVAAWEDNLASAIQVKAFDFATKTQIGSQLNASGTTLLYRAPDITFNDNYFAVVWAQSRSVFTTPYDYDIYGRIGSVTSTPFPNFTFPSAATRIHADDTTMSFTFEQTLPAVTTRNATGGSNSDFTSVWVKSNTIIDHIRGFNSSGSPINITSASTAPEIASPYNSNNYAVVWRNNTSTDIFAGRYDGTTMYASSTINSTTTGSQDFPQVAMNDDYMLFVWQGPDGDGDGIFARMYDIGSGSFGTPKSAEFQINDITTDSQIAPAVAMDDDGNFVVVWQDYSSGSAEIKAKRVTIGAVNAL
jgi:hypothetical protein